jgi:hypothetical protein
MLCNHAVAMRFLLLVLPAVLVLRCGGAAFDLD